LESAGSIEIAVIGSVKSARHSNNEDEFWWLRLEDMTEKNNAAEK